MLVTGRVVWNPGLMWVLEDVMLVPENIVWGPGLVWVLEDVMLVPGHVVLGPGLVWVLQQVGAVPKRKICASEGIQTPILWSRRTSSCYIFAVSLRTS